MNHKTDSSTTSKRLQANVVNATFPLSEIKAHMGDIEDQALGIQTLCEMAFEEIDAIVIHDPDVHRAVLRLDALVKAAYRNAITAQEATENISGLLLESGAA